MALPIPEREAFAKRCETTKGHLTNVAYGQKPCREKLAIAIDRESLGVVPCESLCPGVDWAYLRGTARAMPEPDSEADCPDAPQCGAIDPRHGDRRGPDKRQRIDRRAEEA